MFMLLLLASVLSYMTLSPAVIVIHSEQKRHSETKLERGGERGGGRRRWREEDEERGGGGRRRREEVEGGGEGQKEGGRSQGGPARQ